MATHKKNCQVFTPQQTVRRMLDIAGYTNMLYGKKILENSCGDGQVLLEVVCRYIEDCHNRGYKNHQIQKGLENDIYGVEIDEKTAIKCIDNLNNILKQYALPAVKWNVTTADSLKYDYCSRFQYVVGNPPYITYSALEVENREYIRDTYEVCKEGRPDYYYAFIESAINQLAANGVLVYLVPSNFYRTRFASKLRSFLLPHVTEIYDYSNIKIFSEALTASTIIKCIKDSDTNDVFYHSIKENTQETFNKRSLDSRWIFTKKQTTTQKNDIIKFGDYFHASCSIATLLNSAYIINVGKEEQSKEDVAEKYGIDVGMLRPAVSPKSLQMNRTEFIIFPYQYIEGELAHYSIEEFENRYALTTAYLNQFRDKLDERDSDKAAKWFEYGRSQALAHLNQKKLLLSTLITDHMRVYEIDKDIIPYSGIYITQKRSMSLENAKEILIAKNFYEYAKTVGIQANGTSVRISVRDINNYEFTL